MGVAFRYRPWRAEVPRDNIVDAAFTGPFSLPTVIGGGLAGGTVDAALYASVKVTDEAVLRDSCRELLRRLVFGRHRR